MPTKTKAPKSYKQYSAAKNREYMAVLNSNLRSLRSLQVTDTIYNSAAKSLVHTLRELPQTQLDFLPLMPMSMLTPILDKVTVNIGTILRGRYMRTIRTLWQEVYDLGKKHSITDVMLNSGLFNKQFKEAKFSSFDGIDLATFVMEEEDDIAEFTYEEELTPAQRKAIGRARRNLTILRRNVANLKQQGVLYDDFSLEKGSSKAARLTIEQRVKFLDMIQQIDDALRKADASEKTFLGDEYLRRRYRVLTDDYADTQDTYIKEQISSYLNKNIEGINQIVNKANDAEALARRISKEIQAADVKRVEPNTKAEGILRTELSIAYNFGKLLGFISPTDNNRKFRWCADWELNGKKDYEVCAACANMDGRVYSVLDLLTVGTRLDRGVLRYEGKTRTDFKNPSLPMIPFHPNCGCYWQLMPEDDVSEELATRYVDTNQPPPLPPVPGTKAAEGLPGTQSDVDRTRNRTISNVVGTGLLVGGLFLLSRSNAWRLFYRTAVEKASSVVRTEPVKQVLDVSEYLNKTMPTTLSTRYKDMMTTVIRTAPETLPTPSIPASIPSLGTRLRSGSGV